MIQILLIIYGGQVFLMKRRKRNKRYHSKLLKRKGLLTQLMIKHRILSTFQNNEERVSLFQVIAETNEELEFSNRQTLEQIPEEVRFLYYVFCQ